MTEQNTTIVTFTKRTEYPKLGWLIAQLQEQDIPCAIIGDSFHAPILKVLSADEDRAWEILDPVDDIEDDDEGFEGFDPRVPEILLSQTENGNVAVDCAEMRFESVARKDEVDALCASLMREWLDLRQAGEI